MSDFSVDWPDCAVPGCPRKCCLALNSVYCFPHTNGNQHVKHWKIDARNAGLQEPKSPSRTNPDFKTDFKTASEAEEKSL